MRAKGKDVGRCEKGIRCASSLPIDYSLALDLCPRTHPAPRSGPPRLPSPPLPRARVAREPAESGGRRARHHWRAPRGPGHRRRFVRRIRRGLVAGRAARDGAIQSKAISGRSWTDIRDVDETSAGHSVLIRGFAQTIRPVSKKMGFVVLRQRRSTVQCLLVASADAGVSAQMVRFAASLTKESIVDVEGIVTPLKEPRKDLTQLVEIRVSKIYCINRAISTLPLNFEDAAHTKAEFEAAEQKGVPMVHVHQDTRLNYRPIDIRTPANLSTFTIEHHVENYLAQTLKLTYEQGIQMLKVFSKDFYTRSRRWHAWKCIVELHLTSVAGAQHRPQAFSIIYLFYERVIRRRR
ncbi:hypothetical protein ZWY2020_002675 [Hordeum vulgare]|nr:hypothetical protein ZWY2020_002675 [Hordeum vulgare]